MAIKFRKQGIKFLQKANLEDVENIREQLKKLLLLLKNKELSPLQN